MSQAADPHSPFGAAHDALRAEIRAFVARELAPHVAEWERDTFPDAVFPLLGARGWLGLKLPAEYGGTGGDLLDAAVLVEELARCGSGGVAAGIGAHVEIATPPVFRFGDEDQRRRYVVPALAGKAIGALAITEPGAGSDVASVRTRATEVEGGWVVNGEKTYITNGMRARFYVTAVRTTDEGGHRGMSFMIVDRQEGVTPRPLRKLGWHASDTATIAYEDAFVPRENLLGALHDGFALIMANFQWERLVMALGAVVAMEVALEQTLAFVAERQAFGRPISQFQVTRHRIADLATTVHAGRSMTHDALRRLNDGRDILREVAMCKLFTQRAAVDVIDACLQLHGGAGTMAGHPLERMLRDARLGPIGGGTDEIMREIVGRSLGC